MKISTHVLDTSRGRPAAGIAVTLEQQHAGSWRQVGAGTTDAQGRAGALWTAETPPPAGTYRLGFAVAEYFAALGVAGFYPRIEVAFTILDGAEHHHVPMLLSPYGFSTYRGS